MTRRHVSPRLIVTAASAAVFLAGVGLATVTAGCGGGHSTDVPLSTAGLPISKATLAQVTRGRYLVTSIGCADCHGQGSDNPASATWLAGYLTAEGPNGPGVFALGPFTVYAANITPDNATGIGSVSDRQIYNALKYGLDPFENADITINTDLSNFPTNPVYLPPIMPYASIRHLTDDDIWAIVAYIKHGIKAVHNEVPESSAPPVGWSASTDPATFPDFPSGNEQFNP